MEADLSDGLNEQIYDEGFSKNVVNRKNNENKKNPFIQSESLRRNINTSLKYSSNSRAQKSIYQTK